jgi:histidine triad (HIT) family protein
VRAVSEGCVFCGIVEGSVPSKGVLQTEHCVAFRDINPAAPVHVLVVPRRHVESFADLGADDPVLLGALVETVQEVARQEGIDGSGYRVVVNVGPDAGQLVPHLHFHVLGGRSLRWPPKGSQGEG